MSAAAKAKADNVMEESRKADSVMEENKKRKIAEDRKTDEETNDAQMPEGAESSTTASDLGESASQVVANSAPPAGTFTLDSLGALLVSTLAETKATKQLVAVNTNTTNLSAAAVKKIGTQVDKVKTDLSKFTRRVLSLEGGKGEAKGAAKGGGKKPAVFPMSPRASADPLQTNWKLRGRPRLCSR